MSESNANIYREHDKIIAQLTKERDELKAQMKADRLTHSITKTERDQLAAKCAELDSIVRRMMAWEDDDRSPGIDKDAKHALSDQCGVGFLSPEQQDEEIGRWQEAVHTLLCRLCPDINIDGAGCDSGDPLDFTLSEIGQALAHLKNQIDAGLSPEQKKVLVEALDEVMAEHSATMREVLEIGYSEGLALKPSLFIKIKQALEAAR